MIGRTGIPDCHKTEGLIRFDSAALIDRQERLSYFSKSIPLHHCRHIAHLALDLARQLHKDH